MQLNRMFAFFSSCLSLLRFSNRNSFLCGYFAFMARIDSIILHNNKKKNTTRKNSVDFLLWLLVCVKQQQPTRSFSANVRYPPLYPILAIALQLCTWLASLFDSQTRICNTRATCRCHWPTDTSHRPPSKWPINYYPSTYGLRISIFK